MVTHAAPARTAPLEVPSLPSFVTEFLANMARVEMYSSRWCPYCSAAHRPYQWHHLRRDLLRQDNMKA